MVRVKKLAQIVVVLVIMNVMNVRDHDIYHVEIVVERAMLNVQIVMVVETKNLPKTILI